MRNASPAIRARSPPITGGRSSWSWPTDMSCWRRVLRAERARRLGGVRSPGVGGRELPEFVEAREHDVGSGGREAEGKTGDPGVAVAVDHRRIVGSGVDGDGDARPARLVGAPVELRDACNEVRAAAS